MKSLHRNKKGVRAAVLTELDYSVLNYEELLAVNGAGGRGSTGGGGAPEGPSSSSSSSSDYSTSGNLSDRGYPNSTEGYDPSAPAKEQNIKLYAWDKDGDGDVDHFVNDIGGGQYYDPWTGETGNISDLNLSTEGLGGTRELEYKTKN